MLVSDLQLLDQESRAYAQSAYAMNTKRSYTTMIKTYIRFCLYFGFAPVPADKSTLLRYVTFLARSLNPNSIPGYLNVVRLVHIEAGLPNPLTDWSLSMVKRGILRQKGVPPKQKLPIAPAILLAIRQKLNLSSPFNLSF